MLELTKQAPMAPVLMGIYAQILFLPAQYMTTWEEAFYTGFFEYQSHIFGPMLHDLGARYVAYQEMEMQNPLHNLLLLLSRER